MTTRLAPLLLLGVVLVGCEGENGPRPSSRFGAVGEILIEIRSPLGFPEVGGQVAGFQGSLQETLRWRSNGGWTLTERVTYRGQLGSETIRRSRLNPGQLTQEYAALILQVTENPGLRLFGTVSQNLVPACGSDALPLLTTQVTVTIYDDRRRESARWIRCARGILLAEDPADGIAPENAGPDPGAGRVINAAQLVRFFTVGEGVHSSYEGTVPFATLDRGESSPARPSGPLAFVSSDGSVPLQFIEFWAEHAGAGAPLPPITWFDQIVLLSAVGPRSEAGDSIQVRRVVHAGSSTRVEPVQRVPGDFCSPASKEVHPFHLIVVPIVPLPIEFATPQVERVPCGI